MNKWIDVLLIVDATPVVVLEVKVQHFVRVLPVLKLATVNDHGLPEDGSVVVFTRQYIDSLRLQNTVTALDRVVDEHLVGALAHLPFAVELETAAEGVDFVVVATGSVSATALYLIHTMIV
ncbi:MAG: hypothetical protein ACPHOJ_06350 [Litorivicinaceae bacterium]